MNGQTVSSHSTSINFYARRSDYYWSSHEMIRRPRYLTALLGITVNYTILKYIVRSQCINAKYWPWKIKTDRIRTICIRITAIDGPTQ